MGLRAGQLNERVRIDRKTETPDGQGGVTVAWEPYATVWAKVRHLSGGEADEARQTRPGVRYEVTIRKRSDIRAHDRLVRLGRLTDITSVADALEDRDAMVLACEGDGAVLEITATSADSGTRATSAALGNLRFPASQALADSRSTSDCTGDNGIFFTYAPGDSLASATFSRSTTASYIEETVEPFFSYAPGGSLAAATFARSTTASYVAEV